MPKSVGKCREREKIKIVFPFPSDRTGNRKFQKKGRKFKKNQKIQCGFISSQNRMEKAQREKIKIIISFRSDPTRKKKLKKIAKKFNKVKNSTMASFQAKIGWKGPRKRKNKNCLSVPFLPDM